MNNYNHSAISLSKPVLKLSGIRAYFFQILLIGTAVILPLIAHSSGAPVRYILPMHWPVIIAGLVYGWRSGALTGFMSPIVSYLISGFPMPNIIPSMTMELLTYGLIAGFLREKTTLNPWLSVTIALVVGRFVFILSVLLTHANIANYMEYFKAALLPGIVAGLMQIILLPLLANWWVKKEQNKYIK